MADTKKIEWLSWRGYSTNKRMDLSGWNEGFAYPSASLRKIPYCAESFTYLNGLDYKARVDKQKALFESVDHSAMSCIYMGIIKPDELYWIQEQVARCIKAMLELVQATTMGDINGGRLNELLNKMSPDKAAYLKSALQSSLYFYSNKTANNPFINILNQPLYMELGVDLLTNNLKYMLSEFQVRYMTPFPHLLTDLSHGYEKILPELFERFQLSQESFEKRRDDQLNTVIEQFEKGLAGGNTLSRVLVDAWCYRKNRGATLEKTAASLNADYILFDELKKEQNIHEKAYRNKHLAVINQAPVNLLDPDNQIFESLNAERFEFYDELAWTDLLNRYLQGSVFLANPPMTDIVNDKGVSAAIPEIFKVFYGEEMDLPVPGVTAFWSYDDFSKPDEKTLSKAKAEKDSFVIAHRYLEGGLGIRVGKVTEQTEWDQFIDTFIKDRPYLYVLRDHFEMDPDMSLRVLASSSLPAIISDANEAEIEVSDTAYARVTTTSPMTSENHRSFLVYPSSAEAPEPSYTAVDTKEAKSSR